MKVPKTAYTKTQKLVKGIDYAVKNRKGSINHLKAQCGKETLDEFLANGYINNTNSKNSTEYFKVTKKGDEYYKKLFGRYEYYKTRILGLVEKIMGKI